MFGNRETVWDAGLFRVVRRQLETSDGKTRTRQYVDHPGAVTILPLIDEDHVCLIENVRTAVEETLLELPAGTLEPGEDPRETAHRELAEETGYRAGKLDKLHEFYTSPGILNERMHLFVATDLMPGETCLDAGEQIVTRPLRWDEALAQIREGRICDAKTLVGLLYYDWLKRTT
ncbi:MAG: NUDIX hydrolase [Planctomycetota bacterium]|nr:MAG: NUDIX hydrolase [Planctomycetota bacterium]